jgi:hypothetical protein
MNRLYNFLASIRLLINVSELERAARLPDKALQKHYRHADGKPGGRPLPPHHAAAIVNALCKVLHLIEIDGWIIRVDLATFYFYKADAERTTSVEIEEVGSSYFEYHIVENRMLMDVSEFNEWMKEVSLLLKNDNDELG